MADDLVNALQQSNRSASVLQGIANPPQVNPLAAISAGNQAAQAEFQTRGMQAQQAIGQILQQSTDENGNVDFQKAHGLAARAGPIVQMGMMKFAQDASGLKGAQLEQASAAHTLASRLAANGVEDSSDANWANIRAQAVNANAPPRIVAEIDRIRGLPQEQRSGIAMQHLKNNLSALDQIQQTQGTRQTVTAGGTTFDYTRPPPGRGNVEIKHGPDPGATQEQYVAVDDQGNEIDTTKTPEPPGGFRYRKKIAPKVGDPNYQQATPPQIIPGTGGGPPTVPTTPMPGAYQPRPSAPGPGRRSSLEGGATVASADQSVVPQTGAPGAPSPMVANDVADIQAGMAQARDNPRPAGTQTAGGPMWAEPPQGQPAKLAADQEAYRKDQSLVQPMVTQAQNMGKAYQALRLLKELDSTTGVGAEGWQAFRSRMGTLGFQTDEMAKTQKLQEEFAKYTEKLMVDAAGGGSTNLGKEMAQRSNPSNHIGMAANFDFLRSNLGEALQKVAAVRSHEVKDGGGYLAHQGDIATKTDPRGFVWDAYDKSEQDSMMAEAERDGKEAVAKLKRAITLSHDLNLRIPGATRPPPPDKRSMLMPPPAAAQNLLAMAG